MAFRSVSLILLLTAGLPAADAVRTSAEEPGAVPGAEAPETTAEQTPALQIAKITEDDLVRDAATTDTVLTNGLGRELHRYSPLAGIDRDTVKKLEPVWTVPLGDRTQSAQPIVVDGRIYVTTRDGGLIALDAENGGEIWRHEPEMGGKPPACCGSNLGAAAFDDKIYYVTPDARLMALSRADGALAWEADLGEHTPDAGYVAAPLIVGGLVLTGNAAATPGTVGQVQAHDAETGELVWTRPVIEGNVGTFEGQQTSMTGALNATWPGETWKTGGGAVWLGGSYDPQTNTVVFGTGHPYPVNPYRRNAASPAQGDVADGGVAGTSDNLYAASRLGLSPESGQIRWHYQTTPRDAWGFDGVSEAIPFLGSDGERYWATADDNGFFYVLNRDDGTFVRARPVLDGITWASSIDREGRPQIVGENRPVDPAGAPLAAREEGVRVVPAPLPGRKWMPMSHSPRTGFFYVVANAWAADFSYPDKTDENAVLREPTLSPASDEYVGTVVAIDPVSGERKWRYENKAPIWAGTLATGGGLVFVGTPRGQFIALDDETGEVLWNFQTEGGIAGQPVTWERDGRQFVAVTTGLGDMEPVWGANTAARFEAPGGNGALVVFALPRS